MIIKLIPAKSVAAKGYARALTRYMSDADRNHLRPDARGADYGLTLSAYMTSEPEEEPSKGRERVLYKAAFLGGTVEGWEQGLGEMELRLARRSARVKKPTRHVVISYRNGEHPTFEDCAEAVDTLTAELGAGASAVLWAAHADTDNIHIHVLFVMVDPNTGAALAFGRGDAGEAAHKEAMQRAIARIEHAQGLQAERGARYEIVEGHVVRKQEDPSLKRQRPPLRQEILDFEVRSGFASFTRTAQQLAAPALEAARTWDEAHRSLAPLGIGVRPSGKGGELFAGEDHVKLSNVDRHLSWAKLTKVERLGPFNEAPEGIKISVFEPQVLDGEKAITWLARTAAEQNIREQLDERIASLLAQRTAAVAKIRSDKSERQADLKPFNGDPRLLKDIAEAWTRLHARAVATIKEEFARRIAAVRGMRQAMSIQKDLRRLDTDRMCLPDAGIVPVWIGEANDQPALVPVDGFIGEVRGRMIRYWPNADEQRRGVPAFIDTGALLWVNDRSDASIAAALMVAQARFGAVSVFGDRAYLADCARLAKKLGIEVEEITVQEARQRARRNTGQRQLAREAAAASWAKRAEQTASCPEQRTDATRQKSPKNGNFVDEGSSENQNEMIARLGQDLGGGKRSGKNRQLIGNQVVSDRRVRTDGPLPPSYLKWHKALLNNVELHERQRLADLAMTEPQVRKMAKLASSPDFRRLTEDAQQHRARLGQLTELRNRWAGGLDQ